MAEQEKRKSGGGKLTRSETVTVRLDPKLRMAAELAAAKERRTLSSYIEQAVYEQTRAAWLAQGSEGNPISADQVVQAVWDASEADRFLNLAIRYPLLLTSQEQSLWKIVRAYASAGLDDDFLYQTEIKNNGEQGVREKLDLNKIRLKWNHLVAASRQSLTSEDIAKISDGKLPGISISWETSSGTTVTPIYESE